MSPRRGEAIDVCDEAATYMTAAAKAAKVGDTEEAAWNCEIAMQLLWSHGKASGLIAPGSVVLGATAEGYAAARSHFPVLS